MFTNQGVHEADTAGGKSPERNTCQRTNPCSGYSVPAVTRSPSGNSSIDEVHGSWGSGLALLYPLFG